MGETIGHLTHSRRALALRVAAFNWSRLPPCAALIIRRLQKQNGAKESKICMCTYEPTSRQSWAASTPRPRRVRRALACAARSHTDSTGRRDPTPCRALSRRRGRAWEDKWLDGRSASQATSRLGQPRMSLFGAKLLDGGRINLNKCK